ncbi:hypothetical protein RI367_000434 [Sorochytrium milnesiophthora]
MESYEKISPIGEGTYGVVMKCRHKETGQIVAIKKFKESEEDAQIKKTALREVRMLKQLRSENIVNLLDVFRRKGKLYLVFEHIDHTILEDLEKHPNGISDHREHGSVRKIMWQLLKAVEYLHSHNARTQSILQRCQMVIHRDIKPENILVTTQGIIKLCDFGFARTLAGPGAKYTDYVATRWYRAPELLVGDTEYGKPVDIWAVGCIFSEILTSQPLFPGDSDIDQLYRIMKSLGPLTRRHMEIFLKNPLFVGLRLPEIGKMTPLESKVPGVSSLAFAFLKFSLIYDCDQRATAKQLLEDPYFSHDGWSTRFEAELRKTLDAERDSKQDNSKRRKMKRSDGKSSKGGNGGGGGDDESKKLNTSQSTGGGGGGGVGGGMGAGAHTPNYSTGPSGGVVGSTMGSVGGGSQMAGHKTSNAAMFPNFMSNNGKKGQHAGGGLTGTGLMFPRIGNDGRAVSRGGQ